MNGHNDQRARRYPGKFYLTAFAAALWSALFAIHSAAQLMDAAGQPGAVQLVVTRFAACVLGAGLCLAIGVILRRLRWRPLVEAAGMSLIAAAGAAILWSAIVRLAINPAVSALFGLAGMTGGEPLARIETAPAAALFVFLAWIAAWLSVVYAEELRDSEAQAAAAHDRILELEAMIGPPGREASGQAQFIDCLWIPDRGVRRRVAVSDVRCITAERDYAQLSLRDGRDYLVRATMRQLRARLDPREFVQIRRSTIVNVADIAAIERRGARGLIVRLGDGTALLVGRTQLAAVKSLAAFTGG